MFFVCLCVCFWVGFFLAKCWGWAFTEGSSEFSAGQIISCHQKKWNPLCYFCQPFHVNPLLRRCSLYLNVVLGSTHLPLHQSCSEDCQIFSIPFGTYRKVADKQFWKTSEHLVCWKHKWTPKKENILGHLKWISKIMWFRYMRPNFWFNIFLLYKLDIFRLDDNARFFFQRTTCLYK